MHFMASLNVPGAYKAESFPVLKYLPEWLVPWKRNIREHAKLESAANMALVDGVRDDVRIGKEKGEEVAPSMTKNLLAVRDKRVFH